MKTKHTKGEWVISPIHPNQIKGQPGTGEIASVSENRIGEWEANAKLIAAAPELLNALSFLLNDLDRNDGDLINRATLINEAKQAINKATKLN